MITNHSIGNFLLIGSQCFTNRQFMALGNLPIAVNGLPLVPIGNDMRDTTSQTHLIPYYPKILKSIKNE